MSNKTIQRQVDKEERKNRVAYKQEKKRLTNEVDVFGEYKYDGEDGYDEETLMEIQRFLR